MSVPKGIMLLAIDIGNTTISFVIIDGKKFSLIQKIESNLPGKKFKFELSKILKYIEERYLLVEDVIICSVVPAILKIVKLQALQRFKKNPIVIGKDIIVPVKNKYNDPKQVGQDRLVCAYAARELYGAPAIVIDLGTAITFDIVSRKGEYDGGMIIPGIELSAESLFNGTALLPKVDIFKCPRSLIGKDTNESILSGIFFGYGAMCSGLIDQISKKIKAKPKIIITGGFADLMKRYISNKITKIDSELVFKGMKLLYEDMSWQ